MTDDIVKRLRAFYLPPEDMTQADFMRLEAADRIEALTALVTKQDAIVSDVRAQSRKRAEVFRDWKRVTIDGHGYISHPKVADRIEALEAALRWIANMPLPADGYPSPAHEMRAIATRALGADR